MIRIAPLDRPLPELSALRPGLLDQPQRRRGCCSSGSRPRAATRARSPARGSRRSAPARPRALRRARDRSPTSCRSGSSPRGWCEALAERPGHAGAGRAGRGGARRAARGAARARRRGRRARALRDGRRAADRRAARRRRRRRLRDLHLLLDGPLLLRAVGGGAPPSGRGWSSASGRSPATTLREHGREPDSRPSGTTSTGWSMRWSPTREARPDEPGAADHRFLTDYGLRDEFVGVCHGVIAGSAPRRG